MSGGYLGVSEWYSWKSKALGCVWGYLGSQSLQRNITIHILFGSPCIVFVFACICRQRIDNATSFASREVGEQWRRPHGKTTFMPRKQIQLCRNFHFWKQIQSRCNFHETYISILNVHDDDDDD